MLEIPSSYDNKDQVEVKIDTLFGMLEKNVKILKHQFEEFNIGFKCVYTCCLLEWNQKINKKLLNNIKINWKNWELDDNGESTLMLQNIEKFDRVQNKWLWIVAGTV